MPFKISIILLPNLDSIVRKITSWSLKEGISTLGRNIFFLRVQVGGGVGWTNKFFFYGDSEKSFYFGKFGRHTEVAFLPYPFITYHMWHKCSYIYFPVSAHDWEFSFSLLPYSHPKLDYFNPRHFIISV